MESAPITLPRRQPATRLLLISALLCLHGTFAQADTGKLRLTGGVSTIEGAASGDGNTWNNVARAESAAGAAGADAPGHHHPLKRITRCGENSCDCPQVRRR